MNLGDADIAISKADTCGTLHLAPTALAIVALQAPEILNAAARRNRLENRNFAEDFEIHRAIVPAPDRGRSLSRITFALWRAEESAQRRSASVAHQ